MVSVRMSVPVPQAPPHPYPCSSRPSRVRTSVPWYIDGVLVMALSLATGRMTTTPAAVPDASTAVRTRASLVTMSSLAMV